MPSGNGYMPYSGGFEDDDSSSLHHNPFAGHTETTFTSALRPNETRVVTRPALRRRLSDGTARRSRNDHDPWQDDHAGERTHTKARTMDPRGASSSSAKHHPLDRRHSRATKSNSSIISLNDTRPRLKRVLNDLRPVSTAAADSTKDSDTEQPSPGDATSQKVVIVHEVSPADSLAGVALKYGVSLADLRRTNQMWASDTIHLRKVLYIPLDKAQRSNQFDLALIDVDPGPSSPDPAPEPITGTSSPARNASVGGEGAQSSFTIRRIPASQLSYFPPPSNGSSVDLPSSTRPMTRSYSDYSRRARVPDFFSSVFSTSSQSRHTDRFPIQAHSVAQPIRSQITSFFNALPIAPSTRDTLMARLSLDSSASTPTQGSEEQDHEMGDVGSSSLRSSHSHNSINGLAFSDTHSRTRDTIPVDALDGGFELRAISPPKDATFHQRQASSSQTATTPPRHGLGPAPYASPERIAERPEVVRTAQMEPSPGMQLPPRARRSKDENS